MLGKISIVGYDTVLYERALGPHILLFLLISISKFDLLSRNFDIISRNFDSNSKFRLINSKFQLNILKLWLIISKFRHKISKFQPRNSKFRPNKSKFRLNNSKFWLSNSKCRLNILKCLPNNSKFRLNNSKFWLNILKFRHKISWIEFTPDNLVSGNRWLYTQNPYASFRPWLTRHPNVNKRIRSLDSLIFSKFHRHILNQSPVRVDGLGIRRPRGFKAHQIWKRETACSCCPTKVCIDKIPSLICIHIETRLNICMQWPITRDPCESL